MVQFEGFRSVESHAEIHLGVIDFGPMLGSKETAATSKTLPKVFVSTVGGPNITMGASA